MTDFVCSTLCMSGVVINHVVQHGCPTEVVFLNICELWCSRASPESQEIASLKPVHYFSGLLLLANLA